MVRWPTFVLVAISALSAVPVAEAAPGSGPTAVVSIGDSYISGQAGRWQGNSISPLPPYDATDRGRVYGDSDAGGCHRSDVAEIRSARLPVQERVNLACSGSTTDDVFRASAGGKGEKGEPPQADQLLGVARAKDVEMVVVSIGGNDLGFSSVVTACVEGYLTRTAPCRDTQRQGIEERLPRVTADVIKAIDEIRIVMGQAGYGLADYRLVLQTYPSVIPRSSEARYPQDGAERDVHGCPFYDTDLDWARDEIGPVINEMVKTAARARGVEVLDVGDALQGHEVCSTATAQGEGAPVPEHRSEWGRFVSASAVQQGEYEEMFHPNAFGQRAIGDCLTRLYAAPAPGTFDCDGSAGTESGAMRLTRTSYLDDRAARRGLPQLRLSVRRRAGCLVLRVTAGGTPVRGATVRLAGRRLRTDSRGSARDCRTLAKRRLRITARRRGFRPATRYVRGR